MFCHQPLPSCIRGLPFQRAVWLVVIDINDIGQQDLDQVVITQTGEHF